MTIHAALALALRPARRTTTLLAPLLALLLVATTLVVGAGPAAATGPDSASFVSAVNSARSAAGLGPYTLRSDLSSVAASWSQHMAASGTLAHNPKLSSQVSGWTFVGENVGYGPDWRTIQNALMNSPAHRANILDTDFTEIGVGVVVADGRMWVTQVFRRPAKAATATATKTATKTSSPAPKPTTKPATKPAPEPASKPASQPVTKPASQPVTAGSQAPSPAPTPEETLRSRISDAARALPAASEPDPVAQATAFITAMEIVAG